MIPTAKRGKQASSYHAGRAVRWCNLSGRQNLNCTCLDPAILLLGIFSMATLTKAHQDEHTDVSSKHFLEKHLINETKVSIN